MLSCKNETEMIGMPCSHCLVHTRKLRRRQQPVFFLAFFFRLAEFFRRLLWKYSAWWLNSAAWGSNPMNPVDLDPGPQSSGGGRATKVLFCCIIINKTVKISTVGLKYVESNQQWVFHIIRSKTGRGDWGGTRQYREVGIALWISYRNNQMQWALTMTFPDSLINGEGPPLRSTPTPLASLEGPNSAGPGPQQFSRYWALNISGTRHWPWGYVTSSVTWPYYSLYSIS